MDAVRAPDRHRVAVLLRTRERPSTRAIDAVANQRAGALNGQRERGVEDIGRREPEVEPAPVAPEVGRDGVDERRDVVVRRPLELGDALRGGNAGALADAACARDGTTPTCAHASSDRELDGEPVLELRLIRPDPDMAGLA